MSVVITGIGSISPLGKNCQELKQALLEGKSGADAVTLFNTEGFPSRIGCEVEEFDPVSLGIDKKQVRRLDRFVQFGMVAAREAFQDAGLEKDGSQESFGIVMGTGIGGIQSIQTQHIKLLERGPRRVSPFTVTSTIGNMATGYISLDLGLAGPSNCTVTACAASGHALYQAMTFIEQGRTDVCLAGGSEASISPYPYAAFCAMKAMSTRNEQPERASRPFDKNRDGFVMGEGGAVLVLENEERARKRGAPIYARILSAGLSSDAYHEAAPHPKGTGAIRCMKDALHRAKKDPQEVDYINAHGTSTPLNDLIETRAIKEVFGDHAFSIWVSSTKSMTGHCLGVAGALEALICCLSLKGGVIFPTINLTDADPECDLDYVPQTCREKNIQLALSNSFGFGGHNISLLLEKV